MYMNIFFNNLYKDYAGKKVFEKISGRINKGDKVGIIGNNGVGKSTLARILSLSEDNQSGELIYSPNNLKVLYLCPEIETTEEVLMHLNSFASQKIEENNLSEILKELDLSLSSLKSKINTLSGGEKTKLMLLKAYFSSYDVLILDEPTNHLDIDTTRWLEQFLRDKTFIVISHDRYFLDMVCSKIWRLEEDSLKEYKGNYSEYKLQKEVEDRNQLKEYEKQQTKIENLERVIEERMEWFQSAHKSAGQNDFLRAKAKKHINVLRSKEKELQRIKENEVERPKKEYSAAFDLINKNILNLKLPKYIIQGSDVSKSFGEKTIFKGANFDIMRGEKAALIGKNGSGKTTLLKLITGQDTDYMGKISINPSIVIGYFSQSLEELNYGESVLDNVLNTDARINQNEARLMLSTLLFKGEEVFKKVEKLSMGEKARVAFCKLILSGANLIILDEPTNYLDMVSREKMEDVLNDFKGAVLFVSHDRYFIKSIADKIMELKDGKLTIYKCNYEEYISQQQKSSMQIDKKENKEETLKLKLELAYISGRLGEQGVGQEEKEELDKRFIEIYRKINSN